MTVDENDKLNDKDLEEDQTQYRLINLGDDGQAQCCYCGEILPLFCESHACGNERDLQVDFYLRYPYKIMRLLNVMNRDEKKFFRLLYLDDTTWQEME